MDFIDLKSQYLASRALIDARIQAVLDHGQYIMGPEVAELEARLADWTGTRHCVTVSSGTEALVIALMALGVGRGDEVITSPFSFIAAAEAIVLTGATPVFADVEAATGNLDARLLAERITPRTRAIIPVSLYGQPADMDPINTLAERYGIAVIEDGAQSFGATYRGRQSCALSTIGITSFFPSKPLGCYGDGGALFTDHAALAQAMREIRIHGQSHRYVHSRVGVGGRMDTLQCAVVLAKLERFAWELEQRRRAADYYDALLVHRIPTLAVRHDRTSVHAQYTVLVDERERVRGELAAAGIPTAVHYPIPIHRQSAYAHLASGEPYPVAEGLAQRVLSLPMGPYLDRASARRVAQGLISACRPSGAPSTAKFAAQTAATSTATTTATTTAIQAPSVHVTSHEHVAGPVHVTPHEHVARPVHVTPHEHGERPVHLASLAHSVHSAPPAPSLQTVLDVPGTPPTPPHQPHTTESNRSASPP